MNINILECLCPDIIRHIASYLPVTSLRIMIAESMQFNMHVYKHAEFWTTYTFIYQCTIHDAIINNDEQQTRFLLSVGVNPNSPDDRNNTPLITATARPTPNINIIRALLQKGANINAQNTNFYSALMLASKNDTDGEIVRHLLENNANIRLLNFKGESALFVALYYNNIKIIKILLEYEPNINYYYKQLGTALIYAVDKQCSFTILQMLMDKHADVKITLGGWSIFNSDHFIEFYKSCKLAE